jgi:hypothetical protein
LVGEPIFSAAKDNMLEKERDTRENIKTTTIKGIYSSSLMHIKQFQVFSNWPNPRHLICQKMHFHLLLEKST